MILYSRDSDLELEIYPLKILWNCLLHFFCKALFQGFLECWFCEICFISIEAKCE